MSTQKALIIISGEIQQLGAGDVIDPAQLGTGTRDGTRLLRDDNVWTPPYELAAALVPAYSNRIINGCCRVSNRAAATLSATPQYGSCDRYLVDCTGSAISGSIARVTDTSFLSGYASGASSASWTSGAVRFRTRLENRDVSYLNSGHITVSAAVYHDFGSTTDFTIAVNKANGANNFSAVTNLATSAPVSVISGVKSPLLLTVPLSSTDATNGLEVAITHSANTVSTKNCRIGELQMVAGDFVLPFAPRLMSDEQVAAQRYCWKRWIVQAGYGTAGMEVDIPIFHPVAMRATPAYTVTVNSTVNAGNPTIVNPTLSDCTAQYFVTAAGAAQVNFTVLADSEM